MTPPSEEQQRFNDYKDAAARSDAVVNAIVNFWTDAPKSHEQDD